MSSKKLTEKENALWVILRNGDPQGVPIVDDCIDVVIPGPTKRLLLECFISNADCIQNREIMNEEARKYGGEICQK